MVETVSVAAEDALVVLGYVPQSLELTQQVRAILDSVVVNHFAEPQQVDATEELPLLIERDRSLV